MKKMQKAKTSPHQPLHYNQKVYKLQYRIVDCWLRMQHSYLKVRMKTIAVRIELLNMFSFYLSVIRKGVRDDGQLKLADDALSDSKAKRV